MIDEMIAARLGALEDRAAIQDLVTAIARAIDRYDGSALAQLIHPEAVIDMGGPQALSGTVFATQIKRPAKPRPGRMHVVTNLLVRINGDFAASECHITSWQDLLENDERVTRVRAGRYLDRFARFDDTWRLTARTLVDEWSRIDRVQDVVPQGRNFGQPAPDDPSYGHFA